MEKFLNLEPVRAALGVGDIKFKACNGEVYRKLITDWMQNLEEDIPNLLEDGIRVLIYAGEYDFICNWLGKLLSSLSSLHKSIIKRLNLIRDMNAAKL